MNKTLHAYMCSLDALQIVIENLFFRFHLFDVWQEKSQTKQKPLKIDPKEVSTTAQQI